MVVFMEAVPGSMPSLFALGGTYFSQEANPPQSSSIQHPQRSADKHQDTSAKKLEPVGSPEESSRRWEDLLYRFTNNLLLIY